MMTMCRKGVEQQPTLSQKQHRYLGTHPCLVHSVVFGRYAVHGCHSSLSSCDFRLFRSVFTGAASALTTRKVEIEVEVGLGSWP
jgi:hypothetical protein